MIDLLIVCVGFLMLSLIVLFISRQQLKKTIWFGITTCILMVFIGLLIVALHDQADFKNHYSNGISTDNEVSHLITIKVREVLKPTAYHDKYVVNVLRINGKHLSGKLLLNIQKDSLSNPLHVDDILMASTLFSKINTPLNPYQFDYSRYLKRQYIDHQIFVKNSYLLVIGSQPHTIMGFAARIRSKIDKRLKVHHFEPQELAIVDALLLGQRKDLSPDTYNSYVNAGAIHILAVSGLHVGIILWILNWIFKPMERLKRGKTLKIILLVFILWSFAIIAGLSPSITRAVAMFTVIAISINLKRPANIYNTLAISMFILLLFKPLFLFDVGFQMSYAAVISIASIQPLLVGLWKPKLKVVNYFWDLLCVTIAAQIGVVPISLYYFHQFPGLFFLTNLVILPFLGFILGFGILIIVLALLKVLSQFMAESFGFCIRGMNGFVSWVSHQEGFVFRNISFGIVFVIVSYALIISTFSYFKKPKYSRLVYVLIAILMLQGAFLNEKHRTRNTEFVVFQKSKLSMLGFKQNRMLTVADNLDSLSKLKNNIILNYKVGNSIKTIENAELQSVYDLKDKKLLIVDSLGVYNVKSFKPDYVLLRNSPKINLKRLIDSLQPKLIIADGSNYKSYTQRWKATCESQNIPFHPTGEKGAFVLKY
ncbi:MAG: ComEC/Rec2 family competence protein [Aquaticitalea sp.]